MVTKTNYSLPGVLLVFILACMAAGLGLPVHADKITGTADHENHATLEVTATPLEDEDQQTVMNMSLDQMDALQDEIDTLHVYSAPKSSLVIPRGSISLLSDLPYVPKERSQGSCGNCWVWSSTGALEIEHTLKSGIHDRLSIQYFDDNFGQGSEGINSACCGGSVGSFASWYKNRTANPQAMTLVPWSNANAAYVPHQTCHTPITGAGSIPLSPSYKLTDLSTSAVQTSGVEKSVAINNIKSAINNGLPVIYWFDYSHDDMKAFVHWWNTAPETAVFDPSQYSGDGGGAAHLTLLVGYDDITDPKNPYWIVVNSWGAPQNRRDGTFRVSMNMNYNAPVVSQPGQGKTRLHQQQAFYIIDGSFADSGLNLSASRAVPDGQQTPAPRLDTGLLPVLLALGFLCSIGVGKRRR